MGLEVLLLPLPRPPLLPRPPCHDLDLLPHLLDVLSLVSSVFTTAAAAAVVAASAAATGVVSADMSVQPVISQNWWRIVK